MSLKGFAIDPTAEFRELVLDKREGRARHSFCEYIDFPALNKLLKQSKKSRKEDIFVFPSKLAESGFRVKKWPALLNSEEFIFDFRH